MNFNKGSQTKEDSHKDLDVIVVGSGPGGATVARELSLKGKRVLILDRGDFKPLTGSVMYGARNILFPFKSFHLTPQLLGVARGITVGGSNVFYYGTCCPVPIETLKRYGIDLTSEVEEMRKELPVGPLKDEMVGPMSKRIMLTKNRCPSVLDGREIEKCKLELGILFFTMKSLDKVIRWF